MVENNKILLTKEGVDKLKSELKELLTIKRTEIIKQIQEAREQGDLSENADYDAAKNEQARLEGRIQEIEEILNHYEIIRESSAKNKKVVSIGSKVEFKDFSDNKKYTYEICGSIESDPLLWKISNESPLAKAMLGKSVGDKSEVRGINKPYKIEILKIS
ncbi:MAG: transcription elongation factor GreA [Mycoplasmoidaceae bacterium]